MNFAEFATDYPDHHKFFSEQERAGDSTYEDFQQNEQGWSYEPMPAKLDALSKQVREELADLDSTGGTRLEDFD